MLGDVQGAGHAEAVADLAHQDDRVRVREHVARLDGTGEQVVEQRLVARQQQQAADLRVVVGVRRHLGLVHSVLLTQHVTGDPLRLLPQDLVVHVVEDVHLERVALPVDRFDAVHDAPSHALGEVPVEEGDGLLQFAIEVRLPLLPRLGVDVLPRDPPTAAGEDVQVVPADGFAAPQSVGVEVVLDGPAGEVPVEHPPGVLGMMLGVAAGRHVEDDARLALLPFAVPGECEAELCLADAGRPEDEGHRAGEQAPAEHGVEPVVPGPEPVVRHGHVARRHPGNSIPERYSSISPTTVGSRVPSVDLSM